ncbi:MAG: hypothetical protein M0R03_01070 [Novosphingobium sp.]|nr:hypothetical protein [Novosphingobium sp.]
MRRRDRSSRMGGDSEYEPRDSRNVTGTASTPDGRWTKPDARVPRADGQPGPVAPQDAPPPARVPRK